ncbi:Reversal of tor2 lethality [Thecaphora frezii]
MPFPLPSASPSRLAPLPILLLALCIAIATPALARVQGYTTLTPDNTDQLVGTWSSGSHQVLTGLGFFWPANRTFTPPPVKGISYSFTDDGFWEQSLYLALDNPKDPSCVKSQLIWQHGTYQVYDNGTLLLTPFSHEGCQLITSSCGTGSTTELAYEETEVWAMVEMWTEEVMGVPVKSLRLTDPYGNRRNNMNLVYSPPSMLPNEKLYISVYGQ